MPAPLDLAGEAGFLLRRLSGAIDRTDEPPFHPDATFIDHTPAGWGVLNTAGYVDLIQATFDLAETFKVRLVEIPRLSASGGLFRIRVTGDAAGNAFELEWWRASKLRDGLLVHLEQFPLDQRAEAEACFERLSMRLHSPEADPAPNAASRHAERFEAAVSSGDAEATVRMFAPGCVIDDRRHLVGMRMSDESAFESARLLAETDGLTLTGESLATRGERLVLLRQRVRAPRSRGHRGLDGAPGRRERRAAARWPCRSTRRTRTQPGTSSTPGLSRSKARCSGHSSALVPTTTSTTSADTANGSMRIACSSITRPRDGDRSPRSSTSPTASPCSS